MVDEPAEPGEALAGVPRASDPALVLHVDDDPEVRRRVRSSLEEGTGNLSVVTADDPEAALDRLATDPVDCVVSDHRTPGIDGVEFLEAVREDHPDLPFVLFTGEGSERIASEAIDAGVSAYVGADDPDACDRLADRVRRHVRRRRSESRARIARERLLDLHDATAAFCVVDEDRRIRYWSREMAARTGREPGAVLGAAVGQAFPRAVVTDLQESLRAATETGEPDAFEAYSEPDDDWIEGRVHPVEEVLVVHVRDVTAGAERARREILDRMGDAFFALDDEWHVTYVNDRARRILAAAMGRDPETDDVEGRHLWEEIPEAVDTTFHEQYTAAMDTQEAVSFEEYFEPLDTWFAVNAYPSETGLSVYFRDVTEDRRRREALATRERVLREMHDVIADRGHSFHEQVEALLDLGRAELDVAYGTLSEIRGDDYVFEVVSAADDAIEAGDVVPLSATNCELAANDERTLVLGDVARDAPGETDRAGYTEWGIACYLGAPVFVDDEVYGTFCFYDTEARAGQFSEWEVALVDLMSRWVSYELERELATERLERQNEKLDRFASVVSHDLRNPLASLEGWLELAEERGEAEQFERCYRAIDRMNALVDDLLALARAGDVIDEREDVALGPLLAECWPAVATEEATLVVDTERTIRADRPRLKRLLENLLANGVEHGSAGSAAASHDADPDDAGDGGADVTVTVGDLADGFYVADDGSGIPADERGAVLEYGYSTAEDGTGFGLAIVAEIADAHGWSIRVTEGESGGARFEITGVERA